MAVSNQQKLDALNRTYLALAEELVSQASEQGRSMVYQRLEVVSAEIDKLESKIAKTSGRRICSPITKVNL